jgi:hypothetical protein
VWDSYIQDSCNLYCILGLLLYHIGVGKLGARSDFCDIAIESMKIVESKSRVVLSVGAAKNSDAPLAKVLRDESTNSCLSCPWYTIEL